MVFFLAIVLQSLVFSCGFSLHPTRLPVRKRYEQMGSRSAGPRSKLRSLLRTMVDSASSFGLDEEILDSTYTQVLAADLSSTVAHKLRNSYDAMFGDPREPNGKRFAFDPWVVRCGDGVAESSSENEEIDKDKPEADEIPLADEEEHWLAQWRQPVLPGEEDAASNQIQYSLKRALLSQVLDDENSTEYADLIDEIMRLGQSIGLSATTPPWLSLYMDGDMQNFHTDSSHGPLAYVLSLSLDEDYGSRFTGGETMLMQPSILEYWRNYKGVALETPSIMRFIPPKFGQFVAFDPRIPHGVTPVYGGKDPRHCRVVIHGWLAEPEYIIDGDFAADPEFKQKVYDMVEEAVEPIVASINSGEVGRVVGFLAVKLEFDGRGGNANRVSAVCDTLVADPEDVGAFVGEDVNGFDVYEDPVLDMKLTIREGLGQLQLPEGMSGSIIAPFVFN